MIYIMSDIHGQYDRYRKMLDKINFSDDDFLYILGDIIDRGPQSFEILFDIMDRSNVELFLGNHEHMMLTFLNGFDRRTWFYEANGGRATYKIYQEFDKKTKNDIVDYLTNKTTVVKHLQIADKHYILSHTGAPIDFEDTYTKSSSGMFFMDLFCIVWDEWPYDIFYTMERAQTDTPITLISGHRMTRHFSGKDEVYHLDFKNGYDWYDIDCGCALGDEGGCLGCLAIDEKTGEIVDIYYEK